MEEIRRQSEEIRRRLKSTQILLGSLQKTSYELRGATLNEWASMDENKDTRNAVLYCGNVYMDLLTIQRKETENPEQASLWMTTFHKHYGITFERSNNILKDIEDIPDELLNLLDDRASRSLPVPVYKWRRKISSDERVKILERFDNLIQEWIIDPKRPLTERMKADYEKLYQSLC